METKRFAVKCIFQLTYHNRVGRKLPRTGWVERIFLIRAKDADESYKKAEEIAFEFEVTYTDKEDNIVSCKLYELSDSCQIYEQKLQNGTELYYNYFEASEEDMEKVLHTQYGEKGPCSNSIS